MTVVTLLFLLAFVMLLANVVLRLVERIQRLQRIVLTQVPPVTRRVQPTALPGSELFTADDRQVRNWEDYFPSGRGILIILDPRNDQSRVVAAQLRLQNTAGPQRWVSSPIAVAVEGEKSAAARFIRKNQISDLSPLLMDSGTTESIGVHGTPAAVAVDDLNVVAVAQFHSMLHLHHFEEVTIGAPGKDRSQLSSIAELSIQEEERQWLNWIPRS
ncbi:MAG: hypothetical protein JF922_20065 [Candidatus Dormibacteraeota bacterium]|uniref:Uncharacterized protein n=1 Tax=Candidatus Nephthysia bennettiae TaxID=3127016 RepID=A0A934K4M1_9BACT|nr:hypothetical protein [Candidatus Dormibacteraeota bacterium]